MKVLHSLADENASARGHGGLLEAVGGVDDGVDGRVGSNALIRSKTFKSD